MKATWLIAWKNSVSRPGRSCTAALGIALGIATVLSVQVVDHNTIAGERARKSELAGKWDATLRPLHPGVPEGGVLPEALAEESVLIELAAEFQERVELRRERDGDWSAWRIAALGPMADTALGRAPIREGREPAFPEAAEIAVAPRLAGALDLEVGDRIRMRAAGVSRKDCIDGEIHHRTTREPGVTEVSLSVVGILDVDRIDRARDAVVPFETAARCFTELPLQVRYHARLAEHAIYQDLRNRVQDQFLVEPVKQALVGNRVDQRAFRKSLRVTSALALLLGLFVVYHAFSMALTERVRDLGLLRTIGMGRGALRAAVLAEATLLAFAGVLAGLALTAAVVFGMERAGITTLGFGKELSIRSVPWGTVFTVVTAGFVVALLGMVIPLRRAFRLAPMQSLRGGSISLDRLPARSARWALALLLVAAIPFFYWTFAPPLGERQWQVLGWVCGIAGVAAATVTVLVVWPTPVFLLVRGWGSLLARFSPITGSLAAAALRGSRSRVLATVAGLCVVVTAVFVVRGVNRGHLDEMERFCAEAVDGRLYLRSRRPLSLEQVAAAIEQPGSPDGVGTPYSLGAEVQSPFPLRGVDAEAFRAADPVRFTDAEFARRFAHGEVVVISSFLADTRGLTVGDTVTLPTLSGPQELEVAAIQDGFGYFPDDRSFALLEERTMEQWFCVGPSASRNFVAPIGPDADVDALRSALSAELGPRAVQWLRSDEEITSLYLQDRRRDFYVFDVVLALLAVLAAVAVVNSLWIAILERRHELAVLRALGLTKARLARLIFCEALLMGAAAGTVAAPVAAAVGFLALRAVAEISELDLRPTWTAPELAAPWLAAVVLACAGGLLPALRSRELRGREV